MSILSEGTRKARKAHRCDGWQYLEESSYETEDMKNAKEYQKGTFTTSK